MLSCWKVWQLAGRHGSGAVAYILIHKHQTERANWEWHKLLKLQRVHSGDTHKATITVFKQPHKPEINH